MDGMKTRGPGPMDGRGPRFRASAGDAYAEADEEGEQVGVAAHGEQRDAAVLVVLDVALAQVLGHAVVVVAHAQVNGDRAGPAAYGDVHARPAAVREAPVVEVGGAEVVLVVVVPAAL